MDPQQDHGKARMAVTRIEGMYAKAGINSGDCTSWTAGILGIFQKKCDT